MFCPLRRTGAGETLIQVAGTRFVVDCRLNPEAAAGQAKITFGPVRVTVSSGALTEPNEMLKTVPWPILPPPLAVPYRVLPDKVNREDGLAPSLLVEGEPEVALKLCRLVKPVPSVWMANTVPLLKLPP